MATRMTANGVSTTTAPDTEQYEIFYNLKIDTCNLSDEKNVGIHLQGLA